MSSARSLWPTTLSLLLIIALPAASALHNPHDPRNSRDHEVLGSHGVVATDDGRCSRIGMDVLVEGGHAVDATVAAALCLGVVSAASSGIGGGAFMLIRLSNGKAQVLDMRETAPIRASQDMYHGNADLKAKGPLSVGVPGELAGLHKAWKQHGRLPWERLVRPAEKLARKGFRVSPYLQFQMRRTESGILADKGLRKVFASNGNLLQVNSTCYNKKLAETLRQIAKYGAEAFYNGSVGSRLVRDIQQAGGILTIQDLQEYEVKTREPISIFFRGLKVIGMPPPSSGGASMMLILNILAQYGLPEGISGMLGFHRFIESLKHAFAVRMSLGDPDFVNVTRVVSDMLSPKFAKELKKTINDSRTFNASHYGSRWNQIHDHGTSHISIVDDEENAVSMTTTVNAYFGSEMLSPGTGIVLNNEMDDFSMPVNGTETGPPLAPSNLIRPRKRPLSSMTPTIVLKDEKLKAVVGASGGSMIIAGVTQVFLNHFAKGMDPLSSVVAPRMYHQLIPNLVSYENWTSAYGDHFEIPADVRASLKSKGHVLQSLFGGTICQFIVQDTKPSKKREIIGVSDPRKGGYPSGY